MSNASRVGLIVAMILMSHFSDADEFNSAQKCNEIKDDPDLTIEYCTKIINSTDLSAESLAASTAKRGYAYYHKGDFGLAIADFDAAIRLNPNNALVYIARGMAYDYSERNYEKTIDNFSSAIRLEPNNARYYNFRCWALVLNGDAELALSDCSKSLELDPSNPNAFDSRGIAQFALGNYLAALKDYDKAIELNSEAWSTHLNRARVYEILGDSLKAERDRSVARANAQEEKQYETWLGNLQDAEKNNQHHRQ